MPRRVRLLGGRVAVSGVNESAASVKVADPPAEPATTRGQSYRLRIAQAQTPAQPTVTIESQSAAGTRHALATLAQLRRQYPREMPAIEIEDSPSFAIRGLMLDVSRDRVPTMGQLFETVDLIASLKMNHLQLYTEHTFAYDGHEEAWSDWSPMTPAEVRELDVYCRGKGVELAANQNCFGHLASWLKLPKYAHLAETHGDWVFDVWPRNGPFSLCPTDPASEAFVADLLGQLLPCFSSPLVNIGCDETYDIAYGRSRHEVEKRGRAAVYMEFVAKIAAIARGHGKRSMFWGDIALSHPESVKEIPQDMIALAWGYEPDSPFERWGELLSTAGGKAGREWWVCPGTSSWRSITGRTAERRGNIAAAAKAGAAWGATGFLLCDWGDTGHHQQWPISLHAIADGANAAWNAEAAHEFDHKTCSLQVFGDETLSVGAWLEEFGDADLQLRETCGALSRPDITRLRNQTAIFIDLFKKLDEQREVGDVREWEATGERLAALRARVETSGWPMRDELMHAARYAEFAAWRGCVRRGGEPVDAKGRARGRAMVDQLLDEHRRLWMPRSREGGLGHSCGYLRQVRDGF